MITNPLPGAVFIFLQEPSTLVRGAALELGCLLLLLGSFHWILSFADAFAQKFALKVYLWFLGLYPLIYSLESFVSFHPALKDAGRHHAAALFLQWEFSNLQKPWQLREQREESGCGRSGERTCKFPLETHHFLHRIQIRNRSSTAQKQGCWENASAISHAWPLGEVHRCFCCNFCVYTHFQSQRGRGHVPTSAAWGII